MKRLRKEQILILGIAVLLIGIFFASFMMDNKKRVIENNLRYIEDITAQTANTVNNELEQAKLLIQDFAIVYGMQLSENQDDPIVLMKKLADNSSFDYIEMISQDGIDTNIEGKTADVSDRDYFKKGMKGQSGVEVVSHSKITNETLFIFYAPIRSDNRVSGVLTGIYKADYMEKLISSKIFGVDSEVFLVQADGKILGSTTEENYLNLFDKLAVDMKNYSAHANQLKKYVNDGKPVSFELEMKDGISMGTVIGVGDEDWVMMQILPEKVTNSMLHMANRSGLILLIELLILFVILVRLIFLLNEKRRKNLQLEKDRMSVVLANMPNLLIEEKIGSGLIRFLGNSAHAFDVEAGSAGRREFLKKLVHPDDLETFKKLYKSVRTGECESASARIRMQDKSGDYIWVRYDLTAIGENDGKVAEVLGIVQNIDEHIQRDKEHLRIVGSFSKLYQSIRFVDLQRDSCISLKSYETPEREEVLVYSDLSRVFVEQYVAKEDRKRIGRLLQPDYLQERLSAQKPYLEMDFHLQQSLDKWNRLHVILVSMEEGRATQLLVAIQDISNLKQDELDERKKLKQAYESAIHVNEAKSRFISQLSRQLRVPLSVMLGVTEIAQNHVGEKEEIETSLEKIKDAGNQLNRLIGDALDVSKIESGTIRLSEHPFDLWNFLHGVKKDAQMMAEPKDHTLHIDFSQIQHNAVIGDERRLKQVFTNLISNAVNYTLRKGTLHLSVKELASNRENIGCFEITVIDNGIGMSEAFCNRIFEPFTRAKDFRMKQVDGAGLGMVAVHNIVTAMKGSIKVQSRENRGTAVRALVFLKLQQEEEIEVQGDPAAFTEKQVLLVEDDAMSREVTSRMLQAMGLEVTLCTGGQEAIRILEHAAEQTYHMVLMNAYMPSMSGYETAVRIRAMDRPDLQTIPIITMISGNTSEERYKARLAGINACLLKPIDRNQLKRTLYQYLNGLQQ